MRTTLLNQHAYGAGYVDGALEREPASERFDSFAEEYDYLRGHLDAGRDLRNDTRDPVLIGSERGWTDTDQLLRNRNNIVLTGPPRSGTTLACWLLNKVPNALALHEPIRPARFVEPSAPQALVLASMERFFNGQRRQVWEQGTVASKPVGGAIPDDPYEREYVAGASLRFQKVRGQEFGEVAVPTASLGPDLT